MLKYGIRLVNIIYRILIVNTILDISCAHARFTKHEFFISHVNVLRSSSTPLELVLTKLCAYYHYWNIKSNTVFQFTFHYKKKTNSSKILYSQ